MRSGCAILMADRQYVELVAVGGAEHRVVDHQYGDLVDRRRVIGFGADWMKIHRNFKDCDPRVNLVGLPS